MNTGLATLLYLLTNSMLCTCVAHFRFCAVQSKHRSDLSNLLWRYTGDSKIGCAIRCHGDPRCRSFQYNRAGKQCHGLSKKLAGDDCRSERRCQTYSVCETAYQSESTTLPLRMTAVKKEHGNSESNPRGKTGATTFGVKDLLWFNTTLHEACEKGQLDVVKYLVSKQHADINSRNKKGMTPVMAAVMTGQVAVFNFLRSQGCDLNVADKYKDNLLTYACKGGNVDIVRTLIVDEKMDINRKGRNQITAVQKAVFYGHIEVVDFLKCKGSDLHAVNDKGDNVLHVACFGGNVSMVEYILQKSIVAIDSRNMGGQTPVILASKYDHAQIVDLLIKHKCNLKAADNLKNNILHVACKAGKVDMVKHILVRRLISKESKGELGRTPILIAASVGNTAVIRLLRSRGCRVTAVDSYRNSMLHVACVAGHVDVVKYILSDTTITIDRKGQYGWTPVMAAARMGHEDVVGLLVTKGCSLTVCDDDKNTVLHLACSGHNTDVVKYLLSHGAGDMMESKGNYGRTPVFFAVERSHEGTVKLLVSKGCSLTVVDDQKKTILHLACDVGNENIIRYILSKPVNMNSRDENGMTPKELAALRGHTAVVALFEN